MQEIARDSHRAKLTDLLLSSALLTGAVIGGTVALECPIHAIKAYPGRPVSSLRKERMPRVRALAFIALVRSALIY